MQTSVPVGNDAVGTWEAFRIDVTVPANAVALGLYLRLEPPGGGSATVDYDDIAVVAWAPESTPFSPLFGHIRVTGHGRLTLAEDYLPGAGAWAEVGTPQVFAADRVASPTIAEGAVQGTPSGSTDGDD